MIFSYRTRQVLRRIFGALLPVALLLVIVWLCWLLWLQRFVRYTPQGAVLDFGISDVVPPGVSPQKPDDPQISIEYADPLPEEEPLPPGRQQLVGYYIDPDALMADIGAVRTQLEALSPGTAVLLDVKDGFGKFFYSSARGQADTENYLIAEMDALLEYLADSELYTIARLPALRDDAFASANPDSALVNKQGAVWKDSDRCGWLDPTDDAALTHLMQIARELRSLGFDEVVFADFAIPTATAIAFDGDKAQAIASAAQTLVSTCATEQFTVSFAVSDPGFPLPSDRSRLYLSGVAAADVLDVLDQVLAEDKAVDVVFLADTNDTRYEVSGVLRPLDMAH